MPGALQSLEDQIRSTWGRYGDWNSAGQDQVAALAGLLRANNIDDLSKLSLTPDKWTYDVYDAGSDSRDASSATHTEDGWRIGYDGSDVGFLGDINADGSYTPLRGTGQRGAVDNALAWSAGGGGNTTFRIVRGPDGQPTVVPVWGSSSQETYEDIRGIANIAAMALGGYYAPPAGAAATTLGETMAQGALAGQIGGMTSSAILAPEDDLSSAGLRGWVAGGLGAGAKELAFGSGGVGAGSDVVPLHTTELDPATLDPIEWGPVDLGTIPDTSGTLPLTTNVLDPATLSPIDWGPLNLDQTPNSFTVQDNFRALPDSRVSRNPDDYSNEGRNYPNPESSQGPDGSPANVRISSEVADSTGYPREGRNYPDPASSQGVDGSPANARTPDGLDRVLDRVGSGLTNFGERLADLDPSAWRTLVAGAGALNQLFGGNRAPGSAGSSGGGTMGGADNKFGAYNTWTPAQQSMFDRFANRSALRQPWQPLAKYADGGGVEESAAVGGALGLVRGSMKGQADAVPALLSTGEYVLDADVVSALGDGSNEAGALELDRMRARIRAHKRAAPSSKIPPPAKAPEAYLRKGKK